MLTDTHTALAPDPRRLTDRDFWHKVYRCKGCGMMTGPTPIGVTGMCHWCLAEYNNGMRDAEGKLLREDAPEGGAQNNLARDLAHEDGTEDDERETERWA